MLEILIIILPILLGLWIGSPVLYFVFNETLHWWTFPVAATMLLLMFAGLVISIAMMLENDYRELTVKWIKEKLLKII